MEEFVTDYVPKIFELETQKQIENQLQKEKEAYEKSQAEDSVKKSLKRKETMKFKVAPRDNLRFKSMAQYKVIKDGDVLAYESIELRMTKKPKVKGIALSSRSITQVE